MKITFLGTTCTQPTPSRNHSGILVELGGDAILLDCGEGIQRQLRIAKKRITKIKHICISHWHGDHCLGIPGLLSSMASDNIPHKVRLYGPEKSKEFIKYMMRGFYSHGVCEYEVTEHKTSKLYTSSQYNIASHELVHSVPSIGFKIIVHKQRKIIKDLLEAKGIPTTLWGRLQQGEIVEYNDKVLHPEQYTTQDKPLILCYIADTINGDHLLDFCQDADVIISESTFLHMHVDKAKEVFHMIARQAAEVAKQVGAKRLILTHPSLRYKTSDDLLAEAKQIFPATMFAEDFTEVNIE